MQYGACTTSVTWKKEIYRLLNKILKQKNDFRSRAAAGLSRDEIRFGNSLKLGEFLKHIIQVFVGMGDRTLQEFGKDVKFRYRGYEARGETYNILKEKRLASLDPDLRDLILAIWAFKLVETGDGYDKFMLYLHEYCWDELNQLTIILSATTEKPSSPAKKKKKRMKVLI
ncbi:hypothetical protein KKE14_02575 [Patescibacteria group bacterium]|nr:hypothetical protein [Patescibacteria group bacterium]